MKIDITKFKGFNKTDKKCKCGGDIYKREQPIPKVKYDTICPKCGYWTYEQ